MPVLDINVQKTSFSNQNVYAYFRFFSGENIEKYSFFGLRVQLNFIDNRLFSSPPPSPPNSLLHQEHIYIYFFLEFSIKHSVQCCTFSHGVDRHRVFDKP